MASELLLIDWWTSYNPIETYRGGGGQGPGDPWSGVNLATQHPFWNSELKSSTSYGFFPAKRHPWDSSTHQLHVNERQNPKLPFLTPCILVKWKEPSSFLVTLDIQGVLCFEVSTSIYTYYIHGCPPLAKHSGCTRNQPPNSLGMLTFAFFKNNIIMLIVVVSTLLK